MHFISGLPRSGSTLLASLLLQNPAFHTSIISPMGPIIQRFLEATNAEETGLLVNEETRERCIKGLFDAFYADKKGKLVFDNNRLWCARMPLITKLFPEAHVIALVRPLGQIVDSAERIFREHPTVMSKIYGMDANATVFQRVNHMISSQGFIGYAWDALREAFYGPHVDRLTIVEYHQLTDYPQDTMDALHERLDLKPFKYDPNHIKQIPGVEEFDNALGSPGLHRLKSKVTPYKWTPALPKQIYPTLAQPFWYPEAVKESPTS